MLFPNGHPGFLKKKESLQAREKAILGLPSVPGSLRTACSDYSLSAVGWQRLLAEIAQEIGEHDLEKWFVAPYSAAADYSSAEAYMRSTASLDLVRKGTLSGYLSSKDILARTLRVEAECEARCAVTNRFFSTLDPYPVARLGKTNAELLWSIRTDIHHLIEGFTPLKTLPYCTHGSGAAANAQRPLWKKFKALSVTTDGYDLLPSLYAGCEDYLPPLEVVNCERFQIAPKKFDMGRPIGIQPSLNLYFQLGCGGYLKTLLCKRWKLSLRDQSRNQILARIGSLHDTFSTLDLTSASALIAREVISFFFEGTALYDYMELLRPKWVGYDGLSWKMERYSSMGCGFTFELETILFAAVARAVMREFGIDPCEGNHAVYGDDIIVPSICYDRVAEALDLLGFRVNMEKSFRDGPFRESCGADYYNGIPVRNLYVKKDHAREKKLIDILQLANGILRCGYNLGDGITIPSSYIRAWVCVRKRVPGIIRQNLSGPIAEHDNWFCIPRDGGEDGSSPGENDELRRQHRLGYVEQVASTRAEGNLRLDCSYYYMQRRKLLSKYIAGVYDYVVYKPVVPGAFKLQWVTTVAH